MLKISNQHEVHGYHTMASINIHETVTAFLVNKLFSSVQHELYQAVLRLLIIFPVLISYNCRTSKIPYRQKVEGKLIIL